MIYDCFTFFNESDLLEIRLNELDSVVDVFVICESTFTHAGNPKPLNFDINRYSQFKNKIIYLVDKTPPNDGEAWHNENHQREYINHALITAKDTDLIMISDLDEFPNAKDIIIAKNYLNTHTNEIVNFIHKTYYYYINLFALEYCGSRIATYFTFKNSLGNSLQKLRLSPGQVKLYGIKSGWHFGWLGGKEKVKYKFQNFAHQEYNKRNEIDAVISKSDSLLDMWNRPLVKEQINSSYPNYFFNNQEKFKQFIYGK